MTTDEFGRDRGPALGREKPRRILGELIAVGWGQAARPTGSAPAGLRDFRSRRVGQAPTHRQCPGLCVRCVRTTLNTPYERRMGPVPRLVRSTGHPES